METPRWQRVKSLLEAAMDEAPEDRPVFLDRACAGDPSLRAEVESLLVSHESAGDFLEEPVLQWPRREDKRPLVEIGESLGHYRLEEKLGQGGMGVVYRAVDTHLDRPVAIKVLPMLFLADPERKKRFVQEAKAASALNHPNIVTIHDISDSDGLDFIAMEYVAGEPLSKLISPKMKLAGALKYAVQIADALAAAHAAGVVHRDVKPANIMVTPSGLVKLLDFGLAKLTEPDTDSRDGPASRLGTVIGTPVVYIARAGGWQAGGLALRHFFVWVCSLRNGNGPSRLSEGHRLCHSGGGEIQRCYCGEPARKGPSPRYPETDTALFAQRSGEAYPKRP